MRWVMMPLRFVCACVCVHNSHGSTYLLFRVAFRLPTKPRKLEKLDSGDSGRNAMGPPAKKDGDSGSNAMGPPAKKDGDSGGNAMGPPAKKDTRKIHRCVCLVLRRACTRGRSTRGDSV